MIQALDELCRRQRAQSGGRELDGQRDAVELGRTGGCLRPADNRWGSRFVISGAGNLSVPKKPESSGIERFQGEVLLTGNWPHEPVDFSTKRVAVIGTGASGIQAVSAIANEAAELVVFQRPRWGTAPRPR